MCSNSHFVCWKKIKFYTYYSIYSAAFVGAKADYWCVDDLQNGANFETAKLENISLGKDSCRSNCSKYKFDDSFWKATIIMDFDLICGDSKLATVAKMLFFTGFGTGVLVILLLIYRVIFSRFFSCKATSVKDQSKDFSNPHKVKQTGTFYLSYRKSITVHQWFFNFLVILPILDIFKNKITPSIHIF